MIIDPHPLLDARGFTTTFPRPLGEMPTPAAIFAFLSLQAEAPLKADDTTREAVRALLRHGGFKPAGRSKPASEYLVKAVGDGTLASINAAVDVCNIVSLHSGLPISVVDLARAKPPFRLAAEWRSHLIADVMQAKPFACVIAAEMMKNKDDEAVRFLEQLIQTDYEPVAKAGGATLFIRKDLMVR